MSEEKKGAFDKKITLDVLKVMREKFRSLPEMSHDDRAARVKDDFPQFTVHTLAHYSRMCVQADDEIFQAYIDGKITQGILMEIFTLDPKTQKFMLLECQEKNFTPIVLKRIKRYRREHGCAWAEAIGRATGTIDMTQPRRSGGEKKDLDQLLDKISSMGTRWRAMVSEALELVGDEEAAAGIHEQIFTKAFLLRHVVGEQYDFINKRLQRYMTFLRKRAMAQMDKELKGGDDGNGDGSGTQGVDREEIASRED